MNFSVNTCWTRCQAVISPHLRFVNRSPVSGSVMFSVACAVDKGKLWNAGSRLERVGVCVCVSEWVSE